MSKTKSRLPLFAAWLFGVALFLAPGMAEAHCCSWAAAGACNVFGCNCDGPCSNFGKKCDKIYTVNGLCGCCPGYYSYVEGTTCYNRAQSDAEASELAGARGAESFEAVDADGSGGISLEEAAAWVRDNDIDLRGGDLKAIIKQLDTDGSGAVEAHEFDSDLE